MRADRTVPDLSFAVRQVGRLYAADGTPVLPQAAGAAAVASASANINEPTTPLFQGNGATVFADPVWQAKHPCIVLALQYTDDLVTQLGMMTTDANGWSSSRTATTCIPGHSPITSTPSASGCSRRKKHKIR